jgi:hypothetical protein
MAHPRACVGEGKQGRILKNIDRKTNDSGFILVVAVALMNLVTAVIVEGAIEQAKSDKEVQAAYEAQK